MKNTLLQKLFFASGLFLLPVLGIAISAVQPSGDGTLGSPYQIGSIDNLYWVSQNSASWSSYFEQTADIDASESTGLDGGAGWTPIGNSPNFTGHYDGQGHIISNLYINRPSVNHIGLFGYTTGSNIDNLKLVDVNISGQDYVGGLVGENTDCPITDCCCTGSISGDDNIGGLIGSNFENNPGSCTITRCYTSGSVTGGDDYIGGLIGENYDATIINCYSRSNTSGDSHIGGLVGYHSMYWGYPTITKCYSTGSVSGRINTGGLVGTSESTEITNSYWDTQTSGQSNGIGTYDEYSTISVTGYTTAQMKIQGNFSGWDFTDTWAINASYNNGYPYLIDNPSPDYPLPISLVSFTATIKNGTVELAWSTASETNNARFLIYRNDEVIASVEGAGTTTEPHNYSFIDNTVVPGVNYTYVLADVDYANELVKHEDLAVSLTLPNDVIEADFTIGAAYPNPFNPTTILPLELIGDAMVKASLYDVNGREIKALVKGNFTAGTHELHIDGSDMTTGIYMVKILINDIMKVQKIALVK